MRVHFIAIGGAVMHNLAIALKSKGYFVSGSDDEIFEPSNTRLKEKGLLPEKLGWHPDRIDSSIDFVVLGMHARADNPELVKAEEIGLDIKSFPEFLYEQTKDKKRVVIGGSHGKTTITSMIMHVLKSCNIKFDYMVGSIIEGFETMVGLDQESEVAVFEGDEYLTSTLDPRPKFHLYHPDIAVISGIEWDHINVFPKYENYVEQFRIFTEKISSGGKLIYFENDNEVKAVALSARKDIEKISYSTHPYINNPEGFFLTTDRSLTPVLIFGEHNMQNISAAKEVCSTLGISDDMFYRSISDFKGSAKRLQIIKETENRSLFIDFAHAPSKVKATVSAVAQRFHDYKKVCCVELHTFSSLSHDFLEHYRDSLTEADFGFVYFNPHAIGLKKLDPINREMVIGSFGAGITDAFDNSEDLISAVKEIKSDRVVYLFMSSGDFGGISFTELANQLVCQE